MDNLTVLEWLEKEKLSEDEIDFLLTFIPNISVIKSQPAKTVVICQSMNKLFPRANLKMEENYLDYDVFKFTIQKYIVNKISVKELLIRMSAQKICKPLCDYFLQSEIRN
ncbi:hypothetical protein [Solibacillus cecembensis]|uniref:hypothetical protein n=1 Tax=Solibacillus cecembensis TaxID=459347 RepID=UPI003CFC0160